MRIRYTALKVGKGILGGIYAMMKIRPIRRQLLILSRQSDVPSTDITLLAEYLKENHPDLPLRIMCRKLESSSKAGYGIHILRQMWHMSVSSLLVLDGYCIAACILRHREGTGILQMWHASTAIKKFGYQTVDRPGGHAREIAEILCMHRNYDHILCPSRATGKFFCEAFRADGSGLVMMALPRIDRLMDPGSSGAGLREEYGIEDDRELILYAPTFRKASELQLGELAEVLDEDRYRLVICPHPFDQSRSLDDSELSDKGKVIVDRRHSTYEWIAVSDRVVTDYSAISIEAALTGKPLYFYVYDIEEYEENEGLNVDPRQEAAEITAMDARRLAQLLEEDYPQTCLERFRRKYFEADTNGCTEKLGEYIYGLAETKH